MPPLGPMQKKIRVSEQIVAWGHFSLELGYVQVPGNVFAWPTALAAWRLPAGASWWLKLGKN